MAVDVSLSNSTATIFFMWFNAVIYIAERMQLVADIKRVHTKTNACFPIDSPNLYDVWFVDCVSP